MSCGTKLTKLTKLSIDTIDSIDIWTAWRVDAQTATALASWRTLIRLAAPACAIRSSHIHAHPGRAGAGGHFVTFEGLTLVQYSRKLSIDKLSTMPSCKHSASTKTGVGIPRPMTPLNEEFPRTLQRPFLSL